MVRCTFIIGMLFGLWNTHHYDSLGGLQAVICYQLPNPFPLLVMRLSTTSLQSLLCFDTNHAVAPRWWAFVISCHDWIQMVLGCALSCLWQPTDVLHDGGSQWGVAMSLSMTWKVTCTQHLGCTKAHYELWWGSWEISQVQSSEIFFICLQGSYKKAF